MFRSLNTSLAEPLRRDDEIPTSMHAIARAQSGIYTSTHVGCDVPSGARDDLMTEDLLIWYVVDCLLSGGTYRQSSAVLWSAWL